MEEQDLISRSRSGDVEAFNGLVELYERLVYNLSLRMLGSATAAEDATQDTFLAAYKAIGSFRGGNFKSWLLHIAANNCRDQLRKARRSRSISLDTIMENPGGLSLMAPDESPEDYALHQELGRLLGEGLANIPDDQRLVVTLYDIQGLSYKEIAQVAGCSLGTVKSRLSRGRAHLRDFLLQRKELLPPKLHLNK